MMEHGDYCGGTCDRLRAAEAEVERLRGALEGLLLDGDLADALWAHYGGCWADKNKDSSGCQCESCRMSRALARADEALGAQPTDWWQPDPYKWVCYESAEDGGCAGRDAPGCEGLECPFAAQPQADKETLPPADAEGPCQDCGRDGQRRESGDTYCDDCAEDAAKDAAQSFMRLARSAADKETP